MSIASDVKSGQCKVCRQGASGDIPVLELSPAAGMRVWELTVCRKCAAELRRELDVFLTSDAD